MALYLADGCAGPDGPLGPAKGIYRTFAITGTTFDALSPAANLTLREWFFVAARATLPPLTVAPTEGWSLPPW